jgi:hypothetical protein
MALLDAVREGRLKGLEAIRDRLTLDLDGSESLRDTVALGRLLAEVLEQIEELAAPLAEKPSTPLDELRKRREVKSKVG